MDTYNLFYSTLIFGVFCFLSSLNTFMFVCKVQKVFISMRAALMKFDIQEIKNIFSVNFLKFYSIYVHTMSRTSICKLRNNLIMQSHHLHRVSSPSYNWSTMSCRLVKALSHWTVHSSVCFTPILPPPPQILSNAQQRKHS